jgi:hypothetical protein
MSDECMPAATAAVVGQTNPSVLERDIGETVVAKMKKDINPDATRALRDAIDRKREQGGGHARD